MNAIQKAASMLGKMGRGIKKTLTDEDRKVLSLRFAEARKKRWPKKNECSKE